MNLRRSLMPSRVRVRPRVRSIPRSEMNRPVTTNNEVWYAVDLKIVVMTKNSDPRSGEHIRRLTKISRAQPDYSFFQPPPDYTIQDETGTFTITISRP